MTSDVDFVKANIVVDKNVWEAFKNYVLSKYGKLKGVLGVELTRALEEYLSSRKEHKHARNGKHRFVYPRRYITLLEWLKEYDEIIEEEITGFVRSNFGSDRRTVNKYLSYVLGLNFLELKTVSRSTGRKIYKVRKDAIEKFLEHIKRAERSFTEEDDDAE